MVDDKGIAAEKLAKKAEMEQLPGIDESSRQSTRIREIRQETRQRILGQTEEDTTSADTSIGC